MSSDPGRHRGPLAEAEPDVEVLLAEVVGGDLVRLFIDHPDGVTLDLCERVTNHLAEVRERTRSRSPRPAPSARSPSPSTSAATSAAARACARAATTTAAGASPASCWARPTTR
jgi:hypothetical protein